MATDNSSQAGLAPGSLGIGGLLRGRDRLARVVVVGAFLTLFLLVAALITLSQGNDNAEASAAAEKAFNAILPVLAGWVGTVLAFYFSSASQEHTSAILDKTIGRVSGGGGTGATVAEKMIPFSSIRGVIDLQKDKDKKPDQLTLEGLQKAFEDAKATRLMFVENGVFKYLMHVSTLNKFIVRFGPDGTFAKMLADQDITNEIAKLVVFVSATMTLADAKTALDKVSGAQDIIATGSGNATEPVLGWLSNVDLVKALTVN
jgi:hypothetical protein